MALIDDQMAVIGDHVRNLTLAHQALDERNINDTCRLSFSAANNTYLFRVYAQKRSKTLHPLIEELAPVNQNERISGSLRNERRCDDRLAKRGCRGEYTVLMGDKSIERCQLRPSQFALEGYVFRKCRANFA
ncbi:hypothetical protein EV665_1272 [Shinella granuli]|uniref:Uncharacterized protein n=1 Tax=Shinella granuli TaxID=323621 RepID=A0A4R2C5C2_SHIGR|nr:hypothetical protein EV665_1272 [Shinella granuli]